MISDVAIITRAVYRVIELAQGWRGRLITTEYYFYVLDTAPMIICVGVWIVGHPGLTLERNVIHNSFRSSEKRLRDSSETFSLDQMGLNDTWGNTDRN